jgi:hypothetical protein
VTPGSRRPTDTGWGRARTGATLGAVGGCALLAAALLLWWVAPERMLRIRWEALRQVGLVLPGTVMLAWSLSRLASGFDPLASLLRFRARAIILSCMILVALGTLFSSWYLLRFGPFVPGDEDEYLFQARVLARGRLWWDPPPEPSFFITPGQLLRGDRLFGHHQWGHSALLALGVIAGAPRAVPLFLGIIAVPLCYGLGRRLGGESAAKLSVILLALSPFFLFSMGSLVSETSSMFLLLAAVYLLFAAGRSSMREVLAGGALGLAAATRALSAVAIGMPMLALWIRSRGPRGALWLLAGALPPIVAIGAVNATLTGSPWTLPFALYEPDPLGFGGAHGLGEGLRNLISNLGLLSFWLNGWPLALVILVLSLWVLRKNTLAAGMAIASWALGAAYVLYWHGGQVATGPLRFFEACPLLLCVMGAGLVRLRRLRPSASAMVGWAVVLAWGMAVLTFAPGRAIVLRRFTEGVEAPLRTVTEAGLSRSVVFVRADNYLFSYPRNDLDFLRDGDVVFARDRGELNHELMELFPGRLFYRLVRDQDGSWHLHSLSLEQQARSPKHEIRNKSQIPTDQ